VQSRYLSKEARVLLNEFMPFRRHFGFDKNGRHRAGWLASAAVGTGRGIYVHLLLIGAALDTVNGANIDARQFLSADTRLTYYVGQTSCSALASFLKVVGIHRSEVLPLLGKVVFSEDRLDGAGRLARATVDAFIGMDIQQLHVREIVFVFARMDAVYRADIHTSCVLSPYAGFSDNVRH
jgi:hypothetical protein